MTMHAASYTAIAAARISAVAAAKTSAGDPRLITAALVGIAVVVVLITVAKVHPFLALILGATTMGVIAGLGLAGTLTGSFTTGVGATTGSVGLLVALGAMIGGLLTESGGAAKIVDTITENVSEHRLPWAMAGLAALIGLPLFFEIGVVLLVPVVLLVSRRAGTPVLRVGIPALAGLSVLHGLVPPHPGPVAAISALHADLGLTLAFGLIIAVPTVIIAGPVFGSFIVRYIDIPAPPAVGRSRDAAASGSDDSGPDDSAADDTAAADGLSGEPRMGHASGSGGTHGRAPAFWPAVGTILVPIVMMLVGAVGELTLKKGTSARSVFDVLGTPVIALTVGVIVAMFVLGYFNGFSRSEVGETTGRALPPIAGILLIVAAGGGFKQVLVDAGVGNVIANAAKGASLSPLLLGWLVAVGIRVATGSATVATITAAGIVVTAGRRAGPTDGGPAGVGGRLRIAVLLPRQRRRFLAGQGVLRHDRRSDAGQLVGDGDDRVRGRLPRRPAHPPGGLTSCSTVGGPWPAQGRTTSRSR